MVISKSVLIYNTMLGVLVMSPYKNITYGCNITGGSILNMQRHFADVN